jgi:hypothetical protein
MFYIYDSTRTLFLYQTASEKMSEKKRKELGRFDTNGEAVILTEKLYA